MITLTSILLIDIIIISYFKDHELDKTKLTDQTKFRLYEIKKMKIVLLLILINKKNTVKN